MLPRWALRACLVVLALLGLVAGLAAAVDPAGFYDSWPPGEWRWMPDTGPYNEHGVRDTGVLTAVLGAIACAAAIRPQRHLVVVAGSAWSVSGLVVLVTSLHHVEGAGPFEASFRIAFMALPVALGLTVVLLPAADDAGALPRASSGDGRSPQP